METDHLIRAGKRCEVRIDDSVDWLFVDMGFAQGIKKSCGLAFNCSDPCVTTFSKLVDRVTHHTKQDCGLPLNLLIEAPLSVAFDKNGNPTGRKGTDPSGKGHRYWYEGSGAAMMVGAIYLVRAMIDAGIGRDVRLFEGFASFKGNGKSDHNKDVRDLRNTVKNRMNMRIRCPEEHAGDTCLKSAFTVLDPARFAEGIPPVVYTNESWRNLNVNL